MSGFDDAGVFFSDNYAGSLGGDGPGGLDEDERQLNRQQIKNKFREFIRQYHEGNFTYRYRDELKRQYNLGQYWLSIDIEDVMHYDSQLAEALKKLPADHLPLLEEAAKEIADEVTRPRPLGEEQVEDIQVMLTSLAHPSAMRDLKSELMSRLIKVPGIVVAASSVRPKAHRISIQCRSCRTFQSNIPVKPGLEGYALPRKCPTEQAGRPRCPIDPFFIVPEKCKCVDFQILKIQEPPESVPNGELPRHMQVYCDRYLCDRVVPGNRVTVMGVYSIKKIAGGKKGGGGGRDKVNVGVRLPYVRAIGLDLELGGKRGQTAGAVCTPEEETEFRHLSASTNIYETVAKSIAPSIYGSMDIKKAIACLLMGGSRKRLPDGLARRGDINILLLGDPGTAKSQLLKFVENCAPVAVYTSGKGSSAAGLTASVIRDPQSRNFIMEGGAMVLADGGVVCIDEFDKMREDDRVAIHEAMEQQTISIAKAGITTTLNSRCAVLAAANGVYGRWDDSKGSENIDFMPTILSRFDMIFVVRDEHDENRDITLAKHVMNIHVNALQMTESTRPGEIPLHTLKKYLTYCRAKCGPRLSEAAAEKLKNRYVLLRNGAAESERESGKKNAIPITVRQLEAIVRISESLAKMRLAPFATEADVEEALRLFQVSTLNALMTGSLAGAEGFVSEEDQELLNRIEKQIKRRFVIGSQVSEHAIVQDFTRQKYPEHAVYKVLQLMLRREEIQHRMQRKMLYRVK